MDYAAGPNIHIFTFQTKWNCLGDNIWISPQLFHFDGEMKMYILLWETRHTTKYADHVWSHIKQRKLKYVHQEHIDICQEKNINFSFDKFDIFFIPAVFLLNTELEWDQ